jgi:asparagine synthase (glutamine-hydrolysing)
MAFSIESRLPFLDYQLVEEVFSMPLEHKIRDGITKKVMRDALKDIMPRKITERHSKLGFVTPEDKWIRENSNEIREELVKACRRLAPIVEETKVLSWYDKNIQQLRRGDFSVWRIICAARWADLFNVKIN